MDKVSEAGGDLANRAAIPAYLPQCTRSMVWSSAPTNRDLLTRNHPMWVSPLWVSNVDVPFVLNVDVPFVLLPFVLLSITAGRRWTLQRWKPLVEPNVSDHCRKERSIFISSEHRPQHGDCVIPQSLSDRPA